MLDSKRYIRQTQLLDFGKTGQDKLHQSRVLVIGAGGLGVPVIQYLSAMGVGTLGIMDGDTVDLSNLHRQVIYQSSQVGMPKVAACKEWVQRQNPSIGLQVYDQFLTISNALETISTYDLVIDATDNFEARYLINDACVMLNKSFVYGALQGFEGQVSVFNYQQGPTYRCLYPNPPDAGQIPDCNQSGVLGIVPGIIGSYQALEAVKVLTDCGEPLAGKLLVLDLKTHSQYIIRIRTNPLNQHLKKLQHSYALASCEWEASISVDELSQWMITGRQFNLLDVREPYEYHEAHLDRAESIPLSEIQTRTISLSTELPWVVMCEVGSRSKKAIQLLKNQFPDAKLINLEGGFAQWCQEMGNLHLEK
ncbi:HesA/MoeB/ThiF family protein [Lunatimonas salinarum]|uniref:HesA/MoeB/ThiF family protein n=1 Tax=Lunatimonas salinarum TaxID=1774590 RepID=UPI001ADF00E0|nr:HesA/MoeB/ThiF family protein [Lunatimonas salinarum]